MALGASDLIVTQSHQTVGEIIRWRSDGENFLFPRKNRNEKLYVKKESETTWKKTKEEYKNINVYIHKKLFLFINVTDQATNVILTPVYTIKQEKREDTKNYYNQ